MCSVLALMCKWDGNCGHKICKFIVNRQRYVTVRVIIHEFEKFISLGIRFMVKSRINKLQVSTLLYLLRVSLPPCESWSVNSHVFLGGRQPSSQKRPPYMGRATPLSYSDREQLVHPADCVCVRVYMQNHVFPLPNRFLPVPSRGSHLPRRPEGELIDE